MNIDPIQPTRKNRTKSAIHSPWVQLAIVLVVYAILLLPTLDRQGISWDEQNDLWIAQAYLQPGGWLVGSEIDPSQARLPMFTTALVYAASGTDDLLTGRRVSALVGGLVITGIYIVARRRFSQKHALLAAGLLATSPFYLSFARVAFTETDIYLACAIVWLLIALDRLLEKPTVGRAILAGFLFGLAVSTKFTALALLPGIWYTLWQTRSMRAGQETAPDRVPSAPVWVWAGWSLAVLLASLGFRARTSPDSYNLSVKTLHYAFTFLGWLFPLAWGLRTRRQLADPRATAGLVSALGLLTFFIFPPEHLANPQILGSLLWRAENEMAFNLAFTAEAAALHLLSIVFKSTLLVGILLLAGWVVAMRSWRKPSFQLPVLLSGGYFAGLLILPIAQTFYAIPVLPILAVFAADLFLKIWTHRRKWGVVLGFALLCSWGIELSQCYPDYNLNGYQWLGARPLFGRSSIGYRSVVQTPSDGVQQAMEYINTHAAAGELVQVYAQAWHIVQETAGKPTYRLQSGSESTLFAKPDFVVVHINAIIWGGWHNDTPQAPVIRHPYDPVKLGKEYKRVFTVRRAFGLEAASVWKRK